jgi:hypothetical protein
MDMPVIIRRANVSVCSLSSPVKGNGFLANVQVF